MASKKFLFFSNYCEHSKRFLEEFNKSNLKDTIVMCCIDNPDINIPQFVSSVPTLYIANERRILVDDGLFKWLNSEIKQSQNSGAQGTVTNADITGDQNIMAFHKNEIGSCFSDNYSFIEDESSKTAMHHSYSYLEDNPGNLPSFTLHGAKQTDLSKSNNQNSKTAAMDKAYEQMMQQRNSEMANHISQMRV